MSVIRNQIKGKFSIIENHIITDERISDAAFRVACYLISRPDNWQINNKDIMKQLRIKQQDTLAKYWKQLINAGVLFRREKPKVGGRFVGYDYAIGGIPDDWQTTPRSTSTGATDNGETGVLNNTDPSNTDLNNKDKEDHFELLQPSPDGCSQTSNKFDVNANAEATHRRKNENENSPLLSSSDEYLKRKAEKPKKAKPPVKPKKALFSSQVDKRSHPFTLAALKAIEGVIMEDSEHNFWIDSHTGRPMIQTANIDRVEENLKAIGDTVPRGKESPLEAAITAVIDLYEARFAKKAQKVDLSLIAGIGMCRWKDNGEMDAEEYAEWVNGVLY